MLRYPGDPLGAPEEIYNCRCTMATVEPPEILQGEEPRMTYQEWVKAKEGQAATKGKYTEKVLDNDGEGGIIKEGKPLDSSANNYPVKLPDSKQHVKLAEGQKNNEPQLTANNHTVSSGTSSWDSESKIKLIRAEKINNGNNYETAYIYDDTGNLKFKVKGTKGEVSFTKKQHKEMKNCVITHNHPLNSSFSSDDIYTLKTSGASEIRASTRYGTYVLRPPLEWSDELVTLKDFDKIYNQYVDNYILQYKDKAAQEGKHLLTYLQKAEEDATKAFAESYGMYFEFEKYTKEN